MTDRGEAKRHPAFGTVGVYRTSGERNLFMVDYPQGHYITLRVKRASLRRDLSNDWVHGEEEIIEIAMSEVQYAQMIASPNIGSGVPCTLVHYHDARTGQFIAPELPDEHVGKVETFRAEVQQKGKQAIHEVENARRALDAVLDGTASMSKTTLRSIRDRLARAEQEASSNLGFVVKQAEEALASAAGKAKAEVDSHVAFAMQKLGERALGDRLEQAIAAGVKPAEVGERVMLAFAPPEEDRG